MAFDPEAALEALQQKQADLKAELVAERKKLQEIQRKRKRLLENQIRRAQHRISTKETQAPDAPLDSAGLLPRPPHGDRLNIEGASHEGPR